MILSREQIEDVSEALTRVTEAIRHEIEYPASWWTDLIETARAYHDAMDSLGGMVEWLSEVIVDAREACQRAENITPMGSPDWVESGIAMRTTALREVRTILDRERNADPSRFDAMRSERDAARAELSALRDAVLALHRSCDCTDHDLTDEGPWCVECGEQYPCATARLLEGDSDGAS